PDELWHPADRQPSRPCLLPPCGLVRRHGLFLVAGRAEGLRWARGLKGTRDPSRPPGTSAVVARPVGRDRGRLGRVRARAARNPLCLRPAEVRASSLESDAPRMVVRRGVGRVLWWDHLRRWYACLRASVRRAVAP